MKTTVTTLFITLYFLQHQFTFAVLKDNNIKEKIKIMEPAKTPTGIVNYKRSDQHFSNPERGFYKTKITFSQPYTSLNIQDLTNSRLIDKITLILRLFYLETFKSSPISKEYLDKMQADFDIIRSAGIKCIIRFGYGDKETDNPKDASKSFILMHIKQLKPIFKKYIDIIATVQAGFIGTWGEWYHTSQAEFGGTGYNKQPLTDSNIANRKEIMEALFDAFPSRTIQVRTPKIKQQLCSSVQSIKERDAFSNSCSSKIGHKNDCFLASDNDIGTYSIDKVKEYSYLEQDTKFVPMGGETCGVFPKRSNCNIALKEMKKFHWSFLNLDYHTGVINITKIQKCFPDIQKQLGYRFELISSKISIMKNNLKVSIKVQNTGFAAPFNKRNAYIVLKNDVDKHEELPLKTDPRKWLGIRNIEETLVLPPNFKRGTYNVYLYLPDIDSELKKLPEYAIRFANTETWEPSTGYNKLHHSVTY